MARAGVLGVPLLRDNPVLLKPDESVSKNVGCDALVRAQELGIGGPVLKHQVADHEQRPCVTEYLKREVDWAIGLTLAASHRLAPTSKKYLLFTSSDYTEAACEMQIVVADVKNLFDYLQAGDSLDDFLKSFPSVTWEQAIAALELAREVLAPDARRA